MIPIQLPPLEPILGWLNLCGLAVFAAAGTLAAARARLDIVAACFFAIVTATGGGTTRDILLGAPVFWVHDADFLFGCIVVALITYLLPRRWWPERTLDWCDAVGLAAYATYGAGKALQFGAPPFPAAVLGVLTATMGGIIRDLFAGVPSIILRSEVYITAAAIASGIFVATTEAGLDKPWPAILGALVGFLVRGATIIWGLALRGHQGGAFGASPDPETDA